MFGGIVLGFQRCSGPYIPICQACSTQIGSGRVLYLQRALRLGLFSLNSSLLPDVIIHT